MTILWLDPRILIHSYRYLFILSFFPGGSSSRVSLSSSCSSFFIHRFCLERLDARGALLIWSCSLPSFRSLIATKRNVVLVSWDLVGAASRLSFQPVSSNLREIFRPFHVTQLLHFNVYRLTLHIRFLPNVGMIHNENVSRESPLIIRWKCAICSRNVNSVF